jgi:hypothetical protein
MYCKCYLLDACAFSALFSALGAVSGLSMNSIV